METMVRRKNASAMPRRPRPKPTSAKIRSEERRRNAQPRDVAVGVHDRQNDGNDGPEEKRLRHAAKTATQADERENQGSFEDIADDPDVLDDVDALDAIERVTERAEGDREQEHGDDHEYGFLRT